MGNLVNSHHKSATTEKLGWKTINNIIEEVMEQIEALAQPERESMIERLSRQKIVHNCKICPNINDEQQNWY